MRQVQPKRMIVTLAIVSALLALVGGAGSVQASQRRAATATTPITNIVVFMLENHNFNSFFGLYPGAQNVVTLPESANPLPSDLNHSGPALAAAEDGGQMDEFQSAGYVQYSQADLPTWWQYAQQFGLSDNFFSSINSNSTPNHIALISAGQNGGVWVTNPSSGCGSAPNLIEPSRNAAGDEYWSQTCYSIPNLPDLLAANGLTWRYYNGTAIFDAPSFIQSTFKSPNDVHNAAQFQTDVQRGTLANVSWVVPSATDHPPSELQAAQNWVSTQINGLMNSSYWPHTAIFISWDDWGGMYDPVYPQQLDGLGLGPRVPLIVISPYAKAGYLSHNLGEFSSFAKFIESNWGLPNLGQRDSLSSISDLSDFFDFTQSPRAPILVSPISYQTGLSIPAGFTFQNKVIYSSIIPKIGGPSTPFTYYVVYTLSGTPAVHNVTIDGNAFAMTNAGPVHGGTLYQYTTKLAAAPHTYSFTFSAGTGQLTIPYNNASGVNFSGPEVHPFNLVVPKVTTPVLPGKTVTYTIKYISPQNKAPTLADVDVDGVAHTMTGAGTHYSTGVIFTYTTSTLAQGIHYYRFRFDDGTGVATYEEGMLPNVTPILLTGSSVSPTTGTSTTTFTFSTTYANQAGTAPTLAEVVVDKQTYPMSYISGALNAGALYQAQVTLAVGSHTFSFVFSDGANVWADPIGPAVFSGPTVTAIASQGAAGATPVLPARTPVIIVPNHDDDPDYFFPTDGGG